jgi:hypothetical protein
LFYINGDNRLGRKNFIKNEQLCIQKQLKDSMENFKDLETEGYIIKYTFALTLKGETYTTCIYPPIPY